MDEFLLQIVLEAAFHCSVTRILWIHVALEWIFILRRTSNATSWVSKRSCRDSRDYILIRSARGFFSSPQIVLCSLIVTYIFSDVIKADLRCDVDYDMLDSSSLSAAEAD